MLDDLQTMEKDLDTKSANMLAGVRINYGADSGEYEMAGGTRTSERKKIVQKENALRRWTWDPGYLTTGDDKLKRPGAAEP